jgi:hypothetical protein
MQKFSKDREKGGKIRKGIRKGFRILSALHPLYSPTRFYAHCIINVSPTLPRRNRMG